MGSGTVGVGEASSIAALSPGATFCTYRMPNAC